jgi:beta-glucosidase
MGHERSLRSLVLDSSGSTSDYPREYSVDFSTDGTQWNQVVTKTAGSDAITGIVLPAEKTRYGRINQHGRPPDRFWSIHELEVYAKQEKIQGSGELTAI